jgi:hypothetical protein
VQTVDEISSTVWAHKEIPFFLVAQAEKYSKS